MTSGDELVHIYLMVIFDINVYYLLCDCRCLVRSWQENTGVELVLHVHQYDQLTSPPQHSTAWLASAALFIIEYILFNRNHEMSFTVNTVICVLSIFFIILYTTIYNKK